MPIRIPASLPARMQLEEENIFVMSELRALSQHIRPLRVIVLNLMPLKLDTEVQLLRKLSNTPLQIEVQFMYTATHVAKNVPEGHLAAFYTTFEEIKDQHYDGLIITGAPVEKMPFEEVDYWPELAEIMDWSQTNVHSTLHICWGAQAGLYYHYGIDKFMLDKKMAGVFEHKVLKPFSPLVRGFDDKFMAPHSRHTSVSEEAIIAHPDLELIATSEEAGAFLFKSTDSRNFFITGHPEYDRDTLKNEYVRDINKGMDMEVPLHYFPDDDPNQEPWRSWCAHGQLLYTNWLNYYVYQTTPYDLNKAGVDFEDFDHKGERFFVSVVGRNQVGILAGISSVLANAGASVDDISQNVAENSFSMNMVIHFENPLVDLDTVREMLKDAGKEFDVKINLISANF